MNRIDEGQNSVPAPKPASTSPTPFAAREILAERVDAITPLAMAFPSREINRDTVVIYAKALTDIPLDELSKAVEEIILNAKFFPAISEIRRIVVERRLNLPTAEQALGEIAAFIKSGGGRFSHRLIQEAYHSSGVEAVFYSETPSGVWRRQFEACFESMRESEVREGMRFREERV